MVTLFLICAAVGGTILVCQFLLTLFGLGGQHDIGGGHDLAHDVGHHDIGHEHDSSWFVGVLTFRTIVAAVTFFGLGGLAASQSEWSVPATFATALAAGAAALFLVAWLMRALYRLQAEGTVRIERAVGKTGTVYLSIPGQKAGTGKVTLNLQNRTVECQAITSQEDLPTGTKVMVVAVVGPNTVEVVPASDPERSPYG